MLGAQTENTVRRALRNVVLYHNQLDVIFILGTARVRWCFDTLCQDILRAQTGSKVFQKHNVMVQNLTKSLDDSTRMLFLGIDPSDSLIAVRDMQSQCINSAEWTLDECDT